MNGHAASFLLDTGIHASFLQNNRAEEFGLRLLGTEAQSGGRSFPVAVINHFRAGTFSLGRIEVALYHPAHFRGPVPGEGGKAADGILGLDLLRRYGAIINCRTQQLFFQTDPARRLNLTATSRALGFVRIPIQQSIRGFLSVPCTVAGRAGALVIDTGAFLTVFDAASARALQLQEARSRLKARTAGGRVRPLELASVNEFRIGGVPVPPQRFAVTDLFSARKPHRTFTGINRIEFYDVRAMKSRLDIWGLLGSELLYQHHAIIDLESMALFLK